MAAPTHPNAGLHSGSEVRADHLTIGVLSADSTALLRLEGDLDVATAGALITSAHQLVARGSRHVVIDCGHMRLCDSSGLHALMAIREMPAVESVVVVRPSATLRRLLEVTGLDGFLETSP